MTMDASSREPLLRQAMDRLAHGVCEWKASAQPFCTDRDVGIAHKDGLYRIYRESGLQPWEFHTVLHRALEYGMVEPQLQQLWSEVAAAVVQHPLSEHGADVPEGQAWGHVSRNTAAVGNGGMHNEHWMPANGRSSSAPVRPPGLGDSKQPHNSSAVALTAAGSRLSPDTDTSCSSSIDQRNGRKQQPPVAAGAKQVARAPAVVTKGAAKQQHVHAIEELVRGQSGTRGSNSTQPVAGSQEAHDLPQNGYISAYRFDVPIPGATGSDAAVVAGQQQVQESNGVATRLTGTSSDQQQGRKQQQRGGWEVQEPLDLLPSGLLDDVYDQGDAVVDAPAAAGSSLLSNAAGVGKHSSNGIVSRVLAPTGTAFANGEEAAGSSRNKQRQQKQSVAAAPAGDLSIQQQWREPDRADQQQRQPGSRNGSLDGATPFVLPVTPNGSILNVSMFSGQQQPYGTAMQPLPQQSLAYSQQQLAGLGPASWGTAAVGSYMQPSLLGAAPGGAVQPPPPPPPPPRGHTWTSTTATPAGGAAGLASGTMHGSTAAMSAAGSASGQPLNYAAVAAAGHSSHRAQQHAAGDHSSNGQLSAFLAPSDALLEAEHQPLKNHAALKTGSNDSDGFGQQLPMYQPPAAVGCAQHQQHPPPPAVEAAGKEPAAGSNTEDAVVPPPAIPAFGGLSLFHTASLDSPVTPAVGGPMSPYPSPLQRTLSASTGASPALPALGLAGASGSSVGSSSGLAGMAPMLLPPSAVPNLGAIGEPVGSLGSSSGRMAHSGNGYQQSGGQVHTWSSFGPAVGSAAAEASQQRRMQQQQQQQQQQTPIGSVGSVGTGRLAGTADGSTCSAESSGTAVTASSVATPNSLHAMEVSNGSAAAAIPADTAAGMRHPPPPPPPPPRMSSLDDKELGSDTASDVSKQPPPGSESPQQQQQPPPPAKPMTWAQKLLTAKSNGSNAGKSAAAPTAAAAHARTAAVQGSHAAAGPRIAPAPLSETQQQGGAAAANLARRGGNTTTGQALLAAAKQQEAEAEAAAAAAVPSYSEAAALDGLDAVTAKAAVTAASRMPLPAKMIQAWRSGLCLSSCIKLLQSQRSDLGMALNDRIKGWLCQDCDRATAECLVLFVLTNLRRDWHVTAKSPGAFLMGLLQHRAALIGGSGMGKKLLEVARNFPNVAVYIDSDVLQELGDMESSLRSFIMDEYMCKQRHDWPEGLKFPSQCLLSCMRSIRYADPAVHQAYINLMETRPDLSKAMNGVILYGLCKCDASTGLAAVKRLSELPAEWTSAARVNASAFLYQKVQELCGGHCY